jgi:hypothetical protein
MDVSEPSFQLALTGVNSCALPPGRCITMQAIFVRPVSYEQSKLVTNSCSFRTMGGAVIMTTTQQSSLDHRTPSFVFFCQVFQNVRNRRLCGDARTCLDFHDPATSGHSHLLTDLEMAWTNWVIMRHKLFSNGPIGPARASYRKRVSLVNKISELYGRAPRQSVKVVRRPIHVLALSAVMIRHCGICVAR